jgi:hypothetical protein
MNYLALGIAVAVVGVVLGRTAVNAGGRSTTSTEEQAVRRRRAVTVALLAIGAAILIFDAVQTDRHRWLNVAVVVVMISAVVFDWIRARRRTSS